ncbi:L-arabinose isomerase [Clostridium fungisolvens]|uniref:L-arabinose isomerase n=1 Tax=Clostridium fungisolvens TaxID=1604897 RepID=A0A6V8SHH0_9CLOT|nr:L-arabinose isomerase [Clostridium fungisolvens]GFP76042.1 L-arabinose isomerase [Clostridium fungisolvens]
MLKTKPYEFWFVTGSQHLYGEDTLKEVEDHSKEIAENLNEKLGSQHKIVFKKILTSSSSIAKLCIDANSDENCAGIITWMHTFSPAKMWISGLQQLNKPLLHLHTQYNREIPWSTMDMDFMNTNQSAHGDREYGFIGARMQVKRKIVVGHWQDEDVLAKIANWTRVAVAFVEGKTLKVARFGDNMRNVAVTEGDKVEAQIKLGWEVHAYGICDLVDEMAKITEEQIDELMKEYESEYDFAEDLLVPGPKRDAVREQAKIELGIESFLVRGGFSAFTTNFEDLHGMKQLPGLAAQHLMAKGYGFGGEGDWKTAALVRVMKIMAENKGTAFMEDYTYHLEQGNELILGAHMLEVCPTVAATKPRIEVHHLGIGDKEDPARLVFDGAAGFGLCASLLDMGNRFRLLINEVEAVKIEKELPKLPVARVLWKPLPSLKESAEAWILAGGAHHTSFSFEVTTDQLLDYAEMIGMETLIIDADTKIRDFKNQILWNDVAWKLR